MKRLRIRVPILILLTILVLAACGNKLQADVNSAAPTATPTSTPTVPTDTPAAVPTTVPSAESDAKPTVLKFSSFDGGGPEYSVSIEDPEILSYSSRKDYGSRDHEYETGSPFDVIITFKGLKPGTTTVTIYGRSPIIENDDSIYKATVDADLNVTLERQQVISTLYLYRYGEIYYDSYYITMEDDGYYMSVSEEEEFPIGSEAAEALMQLVNEYDLAAWDGFNEYRDDVLDGEGFWLEIRLTDGTYIEARGDNAFPEDYFTVIGQMSEILEQAAGEFYN